jgi:hypothetical protein
MLLGATLEDILPGHRLSAGPLSRHGVVLHRVPHVPGMEVSDESFSRFALQRKIDLGEFS